MNTTLKTFLGIAGVIIFGLILWYFRSIVSYMVISAVVALIGGPLVDLLSKIKIGKWQFPKTVATVVTMVVMLGGLFLFFSLFAPLVAKEAEAFTKIDKDATLAKLEEPLGATMSWLEQFNLSGDEQSNEDFLVGQIQSLVNFGDVSSVFNDVFGAVGNLFIAFFSILFISFFFLRDNSMVSRIVFTLTPDKLMDKSREIIYDTKVMLRRYFTGIIIQVSIVTILISFGLWMLGVENALLIGFLAGIVNIVPYLGPIIGAVVALFITLTTGLSDTSGVELLPLLGKIAVVFACVQLIDNFFIQPFIFSNSVKAHPLEIFIVISVAGTLAGVTGMILAIPGYTLIRIIAREFLSGFKVVDSLTKNL